MTPKGMLTPKGRRDRTVVVVDVRPTASTRVADLFLQVAPGKDYEVLTTLRALVKGKTIALTEVGGLPVSQLQALADQMKTCRFGVVHMGMGLTQTGGRDLNVSELFTLVAELNQYTRFSVIPMRGHGNVAGADQVMTWQTWLSLCRQFCQRLSPLRSGRVHHSGHAGPRGSGCGADHLPRIRRPIFPRRRPGIWNGFPPSCWIPCRR